MPKIHTYKQYFGLKKAFHKNLWSNLSTLKARKVKKIETIFEKKTFLKFGIFLLIFEGIFW